jgi:hypothetical protein
LNCKHRLFVNEKHKMRDYEMTLEQLEDKYGKLTYFKQTKQYVDTKGCVRRINHTRANGDFMDEMEDGILLHSLHDDAGLTLEQLKEKYGELTLTDMDYYVDKDGIIRRILPYTPLVR